MMTTHTEATAPAIKFIGIAGGSASGKTSIANLISARISKNTPVISLDWFYRPLKDKSLGPEHNWDDPNSFDIELLCKIIQNWKDGWGQWVPRHDYAKYERIECNQFIDPAPVMILEGIYAFFHPEIEKLMDCKIFIDCDLDTALSRRIRRDTRDRGYELMEILKRYESQVKPAYDLWVITQRRTADIIIPNFGLELKKLDIAISLFDSYK